MSWRWPIVPISAAQQLDCRPEDLFIVKRKEDQVRVPLFRVCNLGRSKVTDRFPEFFQDVHRGFVLPDNTEFIVQVRGCHLDCPYCYVTRSGVWGEAEMLTDRELALHFSVSRSSIFHLMGGSPALYLEHWPELIREISRTVVRGIGFHSDFLLTEYPYPEEVLRWLGENSPLPCLFAVNVKGYAKGEYERNTRMEMDAWLFWENIHKLEKHNVPVYFTFTNMAEESIARFKADYAKIFHKDLGRNFSIGLIPYEAVKHNDKVPWEWRGPQNKEGQFCWPIMPGTQCAICQPKRWKGEE